eukprot:jgi/Chlat1/3927/Chrsp26S04190
MEGVLPMGVLADSYKAAHFTMYPAATKMVAYGEFRHGFNKDNKDTRMLFYGIRYLVEKYLHRKWTEKDVDDAALFFSTHNAPSSKPFPFPKELFMKIVTENDGYFPVKLEALPEGTAINSHVPVYQITAEGEYTPLCTFFETLLTMVWYPTTVATLSRRARDTIEAAFERSVVGGKNNNPLLRSRLHDFGMRGCTCLEQAVLGGCANLINFEGTDTMPAGYYAQFVLNEGKPVCASIPATEHSVMTSWPTEQAAIENMIKHHGDGLFACVMDSYDYAAALSEVLPAVASKKIEKGGFFILRPDSGDQREAVLMALHAADKVFGSDINEKGYKVPRGCGVIQGDAVTPASLVAILDAAMDAGFSAQAVAFGMGGGLLQKVNRDTMSFATKLSYIRYADGTDRQIMKAPKTDASKFSLPGILQVKRDDGVPTVYPVPPSGETFSAEENLLKVVYDKRPVGVKWGTFDELRERAAKEWAALPPAADPLSQDMKDAIIKCRARIYAQDAHVDLNGHVKTLSRVLAGAK